MAKIELGVIVKDKVTGLVGVVMGRTEYLTGCAHLGICPQKLKTDGSTPDWQWIDETRCELVKGKKRITLSEPVNVTAKGGPAPDAPAR